ncbi:MAG: hypothetical protein R6V32_12070 [Bacteroidales bacterium]
MIHNHEVEGSIPSLATKAKTPSIAIDGVLLLGFSPSGISEANPFRNNLFLGFGGKMKACSDAGGTKVFAFDIPKRSDRWNTNKIYQLTVKIPISVIYRQNNRYLL